MKRYSTILTMEKYNFRKPSSYFLPIRLVTMPRLTVAVVMGLARDVALWQLCQHVKCHTL